ncbi:MAG: 2OG-Fe dioxygenase family protein [Steroidobacteraceae bacterium]
MAGSDCKSSLPAAALSGWPDFASSWGDLGIDTYMADGGRYRRRRFDAYAVSATTIQRKPPQPHYQSRDYNAVNGGIERWFQPLEDYVATHPLLLATLSNAYQLFHALTPLPLRPVDWHVECHQFRIEASADHVGLPTPEGLHRDGVDWVLVMLVARVNIAEGVTTIYDASQQPLGSFTLTNAFDTAYVDDSRVYHGVTPVRPIDPHQPAFRDVLVVTFRRS